MSMSGLLVRSGLFLAGLGRDHDEAAVAHAALGNDVVGEMLYLGSGPSQGRDFHAVVVVEVDMKRRHREIMMAMIVLHQASRQISRGVVVDIDQRGHAASRFPHFLRRLLHPGAGEIPDRLRAVLVTL